MQEFSSVPRRREIEMITRCFRLVQTAGVCVLLGSALLVSNYAQAMAPHGDCRHPFVYEDASVNLVVLPFRYVGGGEHKLSDTGLRLSLLTELHSLLRMLRYG